MPRGPEAAWRLSRGQPFCLDRWLSLIDETEPRVLPGADDERGIYYRLLPFGKRVLAAELTRLRALMAHRRRESRPRSVHMMSRRDEILYCRLLRTRLRRTSVSLHVAATVEPHVNM